MRSPVERYANGSGPVRHVIEWDRPVRNETLGDRFANREAVLAFTPCRRGRQAASRAESGG